MENPAQTETKASNKTWIIVIVLILVGVVLVLCLMPVVMIALLTIMGPVVGKVFSTINSSLATPIP